MSVIAVAFDEEAIDAVSSSDGFLYGDRLVVGVSFNISVDELFFLSSVILDTPFFLLK